MRSAMIGRPPTSSGSGNGSGSNFTCCLLLLQHDSFTPVVFACQYLNNSQRNMSSSSSSSSVVVLVVSLVLLITVSCHAAVIAASADGRLQPLIATKGKGGGGGGECYLRLEGEEGALESPNYPLAYPAQLDCKYDIVRTSPSVCGIRIYVEDINMPGSTANGDVCISDYVAVESCVPEGGARLCGNETGITHHYNFQPGATAMRLVFHSDASGSGRGFRLRYKMTNDCSSYFYDIQPSGIPPNFGSASCFTRISETSGTINTPYHPKNYPENLDCVYQFVRPSPSVCGVRMKTVKFDLQSPMDTPFGGACSDFFQMASCGFLCGKIDFSWFAMYQPGASSLEFHFHSDESIGASGFLISFEQIYNC